MRSCALHILFAEAIENHRNPQGLKEVNAFLKKHPASITGQVRSAARAMLTMQLLKAVLLCRLDRHAEAEAILNATKDVCILCSSLFR